MCSDNLLMQNIRPLQQTMYESSEDNAAYVYSSSHSAGYRSQRMGAGPASDREHYAVNSHSCVFCGKCFAKPSRLKRHIRLHTGERPFPCAYCSYRATQKEHLVRHVGTHHQQVVTPVACHPTDDSSTTSSNMG